MDIVSFSYSCFQLSSILWRYSCCCCCCIIIIISSSSNKQILFTPPCLPRVFNWMGYYGGDIVVVVFVVAVKVLLLLLVVASAKGYSFLLFLFHLISVIVRNDFFHHEHRFVKLLLFNNMPTQCVLFAEKPLLIQQTAWGVICFSTLTNDTRGVPWSKNFVVASFSLINNQSINGESWDGCSFFPCLLIAIQKNTHPDILVKVVWTHFYYFTSHSYH